MIRKVASIPLSKSTIQQTVPYPGKFSLSLMITKSVRILCITLLLVGCASLPTDYERTLTTAFEYPETTTLGQLFSTTAELHPEESGFLILDKNKDAFLARLALADTAEKTIDVQYYIWNGDVTGRIFAERLIRAADRGIHVRLLIDDIQTGKGDFTLAAIDTHPNIEVRLFNPFSRRYLWGITRYFELIGNVTRLRHRMHNKLFAVDNAAAIFGGRNIGDEYFGVNPKVNFRELELMTVGPAVHDISESFDAYWNSEWAIPISAFDISKPSQEEAQAMYARLRTFVAEQKDFPYVIEFEQQDIHQRLRDMLDDFLWAPATVVYDMPEKAGGEESRVMAEKLRKVGKAVQNEILVASPYFSPGSAGVKRMGELHRQGVTIRVLTNSLASTDVTIAHSVYAKYRKELLEQGVQLYEFRPDVRSPNIQANESFHSTRSSLHAKAVVFDRKAVYVGSYNLNQVGLNLSLETGVIVYSPELAERIAATIEEDLRPRNSWHVVLNEMPMSEWKTGDRESPFLWITEKKGKEVIYSYEPGVSLWRGLASAFFSLFPLKERI